MTSNQVAIAVQTPNLVSASKELKFAGDSVVLSGQIDYPTTPRPEGGYPLIFVLHHAGCNTRDCYNHYTELALECGYAVFRWDKRGTGRSGAGGRGSTTQDAVNAYEVALEQDNVNPRRAVILAQGAGTGLLGSSFGLFARVQAPYGAILVSNLLDEEAILAVEAPVLIVMSESDFNPCSIFAEGACNAHNAAYKYGAQFFVAENADRTLSDLSETDLPFHRGARRKMQTWLRNAHPSQQMVTPAYTRLDS
jgi:pimeloyl-ACP methyl ester carboxylesterase